MSGWCDRWWWHSHGGWESQGTGASYSGGYCEGVSPIAQKGKENGKAWAERPWVPTEKPVGTKAHPEGRLRKLCELNNVRDPSAAQGGDEQRTVGGIVANMEKVSLATAITILMANLPAVKAVE